MIVRNAEAKSSFGKLRIEYEKLSDKSRAMGARLALPSKHEITIEKESAMFVRQDMKLNASNIVSMVAGIWLMISPFALMYQTHSKALSNSLVSGFLLVIIGILGILQLQHKNWLNWSSAALGIWVLVSPGALNVANVQLLLWNFVLTGLMVASVAIWSTRMGDKPISSGPRTT